MNNTPNTTLMKLLGAGLSLYGLLSMLSGYNIMFVKPWIPIPYCGNITFIIVGLLLLLYKPNTQYTSREIDLAEIERRQREELRRRNQAREEKLLMQRNAQEEARKSVQAAFDKLDEDSFIILDYAREIIKSHKQLIIEPEHILLALMEFENPMTGMLHQMLSREEHDQPNKVCELIIRELEERIEQITPTNSASNVVDSKDQVFFSPKAVGILKQANELCLQYKSSKIRPEHLLIAIRQAGTTTAAKILEKHGLTESDVLAYVASKFSSEMGTNRTSSDDLVDALNIYQDIALTPEEAMNGSIKAVEIQGRQLQVKIPPGVKNGTKVRLKGRGNSQAQVTGDLYLVVSISRD